MPVELDRIYASLRDLSEALGPNGVNKDGTLDHVLEAGANALEGKGAAGQRDADRAGRGRRRRSAMAPGRCSTRSPSSPSFTTTLAENDPLVRAFIRDLTGVSAQLAGERTEIQGALASVARRGRDGQDVRQRQPRRRWSPTSRS